MSYFLTALAAFFFGAATVYGMNRDKIRRLNVYYAGEMMNAWRKLESTIQTTERLKATVYAFVIRCYAQGVRVDDFTGSHDSGA